MPETVPLDFSEDDIMWVASNLSGTAGALGDEVIELRDWLLCLVYALKYFRVFVVNLE